MPTFLIYPDVFIELDFNAKVSILNFRETEPCKWFEVFFKIKLTIYFHIFHCVVFHWFCCTAVLGKTGGK